MFCSHCGTANEDGAAFCSKCGNRLTAAQPQPPVQPEQPVQPQPPVNAQPAPEQPKPVQEKPTGWRKWVLLAGSICGALAMLVAFVFTFLIGVSVYPKSELGDIEGVRTEWGISFFFSGAFDDLKLAFDALGADLPYNLSSILHTIFAAMFGSLIFIGFLIAMLVVSIKGIIRYVKHFKGTDEKGVTKLTTGAYFFYALGASLIASMFVYSANESAGGESFSAGIAYNGATVAGLAIGGVLVGLFIVSRIAVQGKKLIKLPALIPGILTICTVVFGAVAWSLAAGPMVGVSEDGSTETFGFLYLIQNLGLSSTELDAAAQLPEMPEIIKNKLMALSFSIVGWGMLVVLLVLVSKTVTNTVRNLEDPAKPESVLGVAIAQLIFTVIVSIMVFILLGEDYKTALFGNGELNSNLVPVVCLIIMSILVLGLAIANKVMVEKFKNAPAQQTTDAQ